MLIRANKQTCKKVTMRHQYSSSSEECSDGEALVHLKKNIKVTNKSKALGELFKFRIENCEFCSAVFYNKYDILVHNAKHIIIPLISRPCLKCTCDRYFSSGEDLQRHNEREHCVKLPDFDGLFIKQSDLNYFNNIVNKNLFVKCENNLEQLFTDQNNSIVTINDKKDIVKCKGVLTQLLNAPLIDDTDEYINQDTDMRIEEPDSTVNEVKQMVNGVNNLRSKLIFEDDDSDEDIIDLNDIDSGIGEKKVINSNSDVKVKNDVIVEENYECIHYDDLMVPGEYKCRSCSQTFPNRYDLITHETTHIRMKRHNKRHLVCSKCDYYIVGNYRTLQKHMLAKHHLETIPSRLLKHCEECGLSFYHHDRHYYNYHFIYICSVCHSRFKTEPERVTHMKICKGENSEKRNEVSKLIKVCELCFSFFKSTHLHRYTQKGVYSRENLRTACERCEKQHFELLLVEMSRKLSWGRDTMKKIPISNESRLIKIKKRLKMIRRMNKV